MTAPRLLVVSHVLPFPGTSGQSQRVAYSLCAARRRFHVTFLTSADPAEQAQIQSRLLEYCDEPVVLSSVAGNSPTRRFIQNAKAAVYAASTGLKTSNYVIGNVELTPTRLAEFATSKRFDLVLMEYWHTWRLAKLFRDRGVPTVLDTHNVLWRAFERQLESQAAPVGKWRRHWRLGRYRAAEEHAWREYDGLIAINREELEELRTVAKKQTVFYAPMGVDLASWPYSWAPRSPIRIAYYGGLGSPHNQRAAVSCLEKVMPAIWKRFPDAEFWIIGSNPPASMQAHQSDPRVHVTGFVEHVCELLGTMSVVLCPWSGRYGFRSRVVEILAAGPPLVVTGDAIAGMDLTSSDGVGIVTSLTEMTAEALALLSNAARAKECSQRARARCESLYDLKNTYDRLIDELQDWISRRTT